MDCYAVRDYEWVELLDPKSQRSMYVNLTSGECCWEPPCDTQIKPMSPNQWWELFDVKAQRNYYYNNRSGETVWQRPTEGDIIPLANLQILQQNLRLVPTNSASNGVGIRRIAHDESESVSTSRRVHHRKLPSAIPETASRTNIDSHGFFETNRTHMQGTHMTATDNQRVRDWLWDTDLESKSPVLPESHESTNPKSSGCFSDRPLRRIHQLSTVVTATSPTSIEPTSLSTYLSETPGRFLDIREEELKIPCNGLSSTGHNGTKFFTPVTRTTFQPSHIPTCTSSYPFSSVTSPWSRNHVAVTSVVAPPGTEVDSPMNAAKCFDFHGRSCLPLCSSGHFYKLANPIEAGPSSHSAQLGPQQFTARDSSSLSFVDCQFGSRHRPFPRTNPTVSRLSAITRSVGPGCYGVTTVDRKSRLGPCSLSLMTPGSGTTTNLETENIPATPTRQYHPVTAGSSCHPTVINSISDMLGPSQKQHNSVDDRSYLHAACSPTSTSPEPSSASSSCSRASSETGLTNTSSCKSGDSFSDTKPEVSRVAGFPSENVLVSSLAGYINQDDTQSSFPDCSPQQRDVDHSEPVECGGPDNDVLLPEQPPVPPPRSASTIGSNRAADDGVLGLPEDFLRFVQFDRGTNAHSYVWSDHRPYVYYTPRLQYFIPTPVISSDMFSVGGMNAVSSLSRNDPMRAHVIPPNHRRPPPFQGQCRFNFTSTEPPKSCYLPSSESFPPQCTNANTLDASPTIHFFESTVLPFTDLSTGHSSNADTPGAVSASTTITWASHSTNNLDTSVTSSTTRQSCLSSNNQQCANILESKDFGNILRRSSSGGFIGPEGLADSSGAFTSDTKQISQSSHQFPSFTLVHPGHPAFARFISPFDWSKDLFKSDQDVGALMSWTKTKFSKRLLANTDASLKKQVIDTFKIIQSFMGDHKARLSLPDYGSIIIHRALNSANLRDELYAQLCKQTTCNPDIRSLTNGWALLCICLYYFPPNNKFRDPLRAYLNARADASVAATAYSTQTSVKHVPKRLRSSLEAAAAIASGLSPLNLGTDFPSDDVGSINSVAHDEANGIIDFSKFCTTSTMSNPSDFIMGTCDRPTAAHFARVAVRWFTRSLNVGCRNCLEAPSVEEICHVKEFILKPCIFGSSMAEIMRIQSYRFPHLKLPWIQLFLTEELLRLNGAQTEGIFRLSPDLDMVTEIRCQLEKLFEIFRVISSTDTGSGSPNVMNSTSTYRFVIVRPPPPGWLYSPPAPDSSGTEINQSSESTILSSSPSFPEAVQLTGDYSWPILPVPLGSTPSDYVLLTPTSQWPRDLLAMAKRSPMGFSNYQIDAHLAAGLLKLWLRELEEPLIPIPLQPICLKAALDAEAFESRNEDFANQTDQTTVGKLNPVETCCQLVRQIPPLERRSLLYLILLLQHLAKPNNAAISLMDPKNLATVIAPNLMRSSTTDPKEMLHNIRPQTLFVRLLISHLNVEEEVTHLLTTTTTATTSQSFSV